MRIMLRLQLTLVCVLGLSAGACSPKESETHEELSPEMQRAIEYFKPQLLAMDGKRGDFEGVLSLGPESASFAFCSKDECPEGEDPIGCHAEMRDPAYAARPNKFAEDGYYHMWVRGVIQTGAKAGGQQTFGHMGGKLCKIQINKIYRVEKVDNFQVRASKH